MDDHNNNIDDTFGGMFGPLQFPLNVPPQFRVAPAENPPVEGLVPPVMMVAPAGNVPVEGAVPPEIMAAPAGDVPMQGAVPLENMAAPAGHVPLEGVDIPEMAAAPDGNVPVQGAVAQVMMDAPGEGAVPPAMAAAPTGNVPVVNAVPISVVPAAVTPGTCSESVPGTGGASRADTSGRKKRGRPKMYDDQGKLIAPSGAAAGPSRSCKGRGRAAGSGNLQPPTPSQFGEEGRLPLSMVSWGFTPHLIMAETGEDVAVKVATFAVHNGSKGICVLSATGTVSKVSIRQIGVCGASQTFEGLFQIMALSGSFSAADSGIRRGRAGGLSVALAGADGRIIGGGIAGTLVAASPIKVVIGTFESGVWQNRTQAGLSQLPAPPVNPGANIFVSPMQAGQVVNPGANVFQQNDRESGKSDVSRQ